MAQLVIITVAMDMIHVFSKNLRDLRALRGLTQAYLAELAGADTITIGNYENGRHWPGPRRVAALAAALNVPETRLFADPSLKPSTIEAWEVITEKLGLEGSRGAIKRPHQWRCPQGLLIRIINQ